MGKNDAVAVDSKFSKEDLTNAQALDLLIIQRKNDLNNLQAQIAVANARLKTTQERIGEERGAFNSQMATEKTKSDQTCQLKTNDLLQREELVQRNEQSLTDRERTIKVRETQVDKVDDERTQLFNLRVETEKIQSEARVAKENTEHSESEALVKIENASNKEKEADKKLQEMSNKLQEATLLNNDTKKKEQSIADETKNLLKLREEVGPQLEKLEKLTSDNQRILSDTEKRAKEIDVKLNENRQLVDKIISEKNALDKKSIEFSTREKEILRKEAELNIG